MLQLAWKNILYRKMRAILTTLGVATSVMLVVFMSSILTATEQNLIDSFGRLGGQIRVQPRSTAMDGQSTDVVPAGIFLDETEVAQILSRAEGYDPAASSPMISQVIVPPLGPNMPPVAVLNGVEPGHEQAVLMGAEAAQGEASLAGERDVILGAGAHGHYATKEGRPLAPGDRFVIPGAGEFRLKAILTKTDPMTDAAVIIPLATAQEALRRGQTVNFVALSYKLEQVRSAAAALEEQFPDLDVVTAEAMLEAADKALSGQRTFFQIINGTVWLTAVMIIFMVMYTAVMERTKEIGTMRAVGAPRSAVVGAVLTEAALFALAGSAIGSAGAWSLITGWDLFTDIQFVGVALETALITVMLAALSALYPAVRAARVNPLEALRYE